MRSVASAAVQAMGQERMYHRYGIEVLSSFLIKKMERKKELGRAQ